MIGTMVRGAVSRWVKKLKRVFCPALIDPPSPALRLAILPAIPHPHPQSTQRDDDHKVA
jgi:hypothetical protein